ncbi:MAG: cobalamin B12-binding domain-containing protein [Endomicrobium sp.]|jgi:radical SAM superfamily enzyme YgiQ (UPF0313 family)|nr:cobalamin B12-binding domain-containing protein [Endomicrobium sp.]
MKYNYLIIMPRLINNFNEGYNFPIGICYISAVLKQAGFNVFTVNLNHVEGEVGDVVEAEILKHDIDVVLTGGLSFQFISLQEIVDKIRFKFPNIKIVVGGGVITGCPEVAMQAFEGKVDIGVIGEGEVTIVELATALENNKRLNMIKGIIYRNPEVNNGGGGV